MKRPDSLVDLARTRALGVDTMVFIYHLGEDPRYGDAVAPLFDLWGGEGSPAAVASVLALTETLVGPLRSGATEAAARAERWLRALPGLAFEPVTADVASRAAGLRARHGLATPDALHLATAIEHGAERFLTHDRSLARVDEVEIVLLEDFVSGTLKN